MWCHNSTTVSWNCTQIVTKFHFSWKCIFPLLLHLGMLGLRWMCMHLWMNLIKRISKKKKKIVKIYVQSQWRVVLFWYHIFWQSSIQRGRHTQLCIITSLKWIIQICSNFYCWVCKIAFYTHPIHIVVWGNSPLSASKRWKQKSDRMYHTHFPP